MSVCVCMRECSKGQLEVGAFYLFAFCYLKKKRRRRNQTELECSSSCGPKKKERHKPARHVAHNGLGGDGGGWRASLVIPFYVLFFYNTVGTQQGSEHPPFFVYCFLKKKGFTLDASNQSSLLALIPNAHQK